MSADPGTASFPETSGVERVQLMDAAEIGRTLRRMAGEIVVRHRAQGTRRLALVGIHTRGVEVARRLCDLIGEAEGERPAFGMIDVSMHRDDLRRRARLTSIQPTRLPVDLETRTVILTDDVFFTGRTVRAALDALGEYGRAPSIQLAALVDRGHRELPIRPDYTGLEVRTALSDRVQVKFAPGDGEADSVWVSQGENHRQR